VNFNHVKLESLDFELESVTTDDGRRYTTPDGKVYPSITTVLSSYNKQAILEWRQRVGEEEANRVSRKASNRGTKLHSTVEQYLLNEMSPLKMHTMMPDMKELFLKLKPFLDENVNNIYGIEQPLYSHRLRLAGRCDCIGEWDGKISIIDWKTANYSKEKDQIANYFMQASAYAEMFGEITGIEVNQIVVAIAVENQPPQIFIEEKSKYLDGLNSYIGKYWSKA
jgi:genome maintenance exonuclease 1